MQATADLTTCEKEPIQWPGFIQSHGLLIAVDPVEFTIWQASENIEELAGQPVASLIGQSIATIQLGDLAGSLIHDMLVIAMRSGRPEAFNPYPVKIRGRDWLAIMHQQDGALIVELEPTSQLHGGLAKPLHSLIAQAMSDIQRSKTLSQLLEKTAQQIKQITGFDRVMIYRFGEDWHGEVVAEAREEHLVPFLGLHYPASDIPRQARELYKVNLVRGIADVEEPRVPILPVNYAQHNRPLDLTHATLRSVSPVHVEYLSNMGVRASMSISLLYRSELWGLIACHHYSGPRFIDYPARQSIKLVSQLLSTVLEIRKDDEESEVSDRLHDNELALYQQMIADWDVVQGLTKHPITILDLNEATGAALLFEEELHLLGDTPEPNEILTLIDWLKNTTPESVFQTNQLPNLYPPAEGFRTKAAGVLMVVLSRQMNEYLLWFKPEQIQDVSWGGNPDKPVEQTASGELRLSPRKSFDKWTQIVRNKSQSWQQVEVALALKLREDLLQIVAGKANQIRALNEQLRLANEELEAFSYTVSHDLRSPLSSIKRYTEIYKEDYGDLMDDNAKAIFDRIVKASDRMSMLIRNIMQYSQVGSSGLARRLLPMKDMLLQLRDELLAGETTRDITFQIEETPDLEGDQTMVNQVFSNLLSNAIKYTRSVPEARIVIKGSQSNQEVIYAVTDNGIGIDMKQAGKVFELFQRLDSAASYEGYGVGLAIVKRILSRHQGKVWFESVPHQATTFYVSFPRRIS
ncbi:ATP-binding protein [Spirosoma fluviale]|uniref:histidine kinase n=1 Tax=Spirosoma fluviale TaxID=1597977 RepID=A0A286GBD4_9BACT|nr:ATP-binding protein [Spirosoma fluviale]SOD92802.1 Bacteriophytochrome (light-regulated signal transduction histidine kinase) [Spirosoma fluviale]